MLKKQIQRYFRYRFPLVTRKTNNKVIRKLIHVQNQQSRLIDPDEIYSGKWSKQEHSIYFSVKHLGEYLGDADDDGLFYDLSSYGQEEIVEAITDHLDDIEKASKEIRDTLPKPSRVNNTQAS